MIDVETELKAHLEWAEGRRKTLYDDATGKPIVSGSVVVGNPTVGVGINLAEPLSDDEVDYLRDRRIDRAFANCRRLPYFDALDPARRLVVLDLVFNMGLARWRSFAGANAALAAGDYARAADELEWRDPATKAEVTPYVKQTGRRARKNIDALRSGVWKREAR